MTSQTQAAPLLHATTKQGHAAMTDLNPRYVAYAIAHGVTTDERKAADRVEYPGGRGAGFIIWNGQQRRAWRAETKVSRALTAEQHDAYDAWLAAKFPLPLPVAA